MQRFFLTIFLFLITSSTQAWVSVSPSTNQRRLQQIQFDKFFLYNSNNNEAEEWSDFEDMGYFNTGPSSNGNNNSSNNENKKSKEYGFNDDDFVNEASMKMDLTQLMQERTRAIDWTGIQSRQFSLGQDIILSDYVGNMGFDEVTDWEYYYPSEDNNDDERKVVQPNPFDSSKPRRTRTSSGSVIRIFRGEFVGQVGGMLSSQGLDRRLLVKEFTGDLALALANAELESIGRLQSDLIEKVDESAERGEWIQAASSRSIQLRQDSSNVVQLVKMMADAPYLGILGEVNLAELDGEMEPNEFYRALGVAPPSPDAVWIVYEYAGLSTIQAYAEPAQVRRAKLPPQKGFFGNIVQPPQLPSWNDRASYVVNGIMKKSIIALATLHESGVVHRSIGRTSIVISTKVMDKRDAISPFNTMISNLRIKLADFGFSGPYDRSTMDEEFCTRARSFGFSFRKGDNSVATANFAIAEDMRALGFVFLGLLLTSLAEIPNPNDPRMPATDDDTLQRLFEEIFDKDIEQFRDYIEAEPIWSNLVDLLDKNDGAGWKVLQTLLLAREKAVKNKDKTEMLTVRGLLSSSFFS